MKHKKHKKHASPMQRLSPEAEARVLELYRTNSTEQTARLAGTRVSHISSIIKRHRREVGYYLKKRSALYPDIPRHTVIPYDKLGHSGGGATGPHAHPEPEHITSVDALEKEPSVEVERPLWGGSHITQNRMALDTTLTLLRHEMSECSRKLEHFDAELETLTEMWEKAVEDSRAVMAKQNALEAAVLEVEALNEAAE